MSTSIFEDPYYAPLLQKSIERIFNSRMLLDEDLEVLINAYELSIPECKLSDFPHGLIASLSSMVGSLILIKLTKTSPMYLVPSALVTAGLAVQELMYRLKKVRHNKLIDELTGVLKNLAKLLGRIYRYFESRGKIKEESEHSFFKLSNKHVRNFMKNFVENQLNLNQFYLNNMLEISKFYNLLAEDCQNYIFTPSDFFKDFENADLEKCCSTVETFEKMQILINSKLLGYLGVIFCDSSSCLDKRNLDFILDVRIPNIIKDTSRQCDYLSRLFTKLRKSVLQINRRNQSAVLNTNFVSKKLNIVLENTLHNLCFVTEKTQNILEAIETSNDNTYSDADKINEGLLDLRKHTYSAFESIDILCNMYGILAKRTKHSETNIPVPVLTTNEAPVNQVETINYDDEISPLDEHYELYLEKQFCDVQPAFNYEEKSDTHITLLLQELKQALNNHERFIEARKKRENLEVEKIKQIPPVPQPRKFRTNMPDEEKLKTINTKSFREGGIPLPPPVPVPILTDHVNITNHSELLEGIKLLASQLNTKEETFGDDGSISDGD